MVFDLWSAITNEEIDGHKLHILKVNASEFDEATLDLALVVPEQYVDPASLADTLKKLGKTAAAEKLRTKLPLTKKLRSGDLGEILATEYINNNTKFDTPIKKLRWHDHREMAMRGDDVIGLDLRRKRPRFLKTEAKSRAALGSAVLNEARSALDADNSRPAPHALAFVADRLREIGQIEAADIIETALYKQGVNLGQMEHLLFTFSGSNPKKLQKTQLKNYDGRVKQHAVGVFVKSHQKFISDVFESVREGLDD